MNKGMFGFPTQMAASESRDGFEKLTASSGEWPWPNGVTAATFWIQAAGGGASVGATVATDGGDSSITYNSVTTTAEGGDGGASGVTPTPGGNSGGGDFSITGKYGRAGVGGDSFFGYGGVLSSHSPAAGGGGGGDQAGGGGEMVRKRVVKVDGLSTVAYTVGQGGAGANGGQAGAAGFILVEWTAPLKTA